MYLIGNFKTWKTWPETGIKFQVSPLSDEQRDAVRAKIAELPEDERVRGFALEAADACLHDWDGVGGFNADGKAVALPLTRENLELLMQDERARQYLIDLFLFEGVRKAEAVADAGNA